MKEKKIKVLYILGPTFMGGATISFKIIFDGMIDRGCDIVVLVSKTNPNIDFINYMASRDCVVEIFDAEMSIYPECELLGWSHSFIKYPIKLIRKILRLQRSYHQVFNLIQKHQAVIFDRNIGVFHQGLKACRKLGIPHLWHIREYQTIGLGWKIFPSMQYFKKLLRKSNVITISKDLLKFFELNEQKNAKAIWNGILTANSADYISEKKNFFLSASRISPQKNIETIIEAFSNVADLIPNYRLLIVGDADSKEYLDNLIYKVSKLSCSDRIEFLGYRNNIIELMKEASAIVVSSNHEGLGRMTIEASFMGCLVLGRNEGGTKEIIETTNGGFLFDSKEELSNLMVDVAKIVGTDLYKKMALDAQKIAIDRSSSENYCKVIYEMYTNIIQTKNEKAN